MVVVPAGSFMMGSPPIEKDRDKTEGPQHPVTISRAFAVGKYEVTFAEWDGVLMLLVAMVHLPLVVLFALVG